MTGWRQNLVGLLMLPLSILPFSAYVTQTAEGGLLWAKATHPLFAPELPDLDRGDVTSINDKAPRYSSAAAVLVYHGLGTSVGEEASQTMTAEQFGEHLMALRTAGMEPVTATEFADACAGGPPLPDNAVMVTFDDGRTEAMMHADPLLDQADMTATMFVISGAADTPSLFYAGWAKLEDYHASGRWDLQAHTDALHATIPTEATDEVQQRPLLVNRLDGESLADWRRRVTADLDASSDKLREHTGSRPVAFAYPFGSYGGDPRSNDPKIEQELREVMADHIDVAFQQDDQETVDLADCDDDPLMLRRLDVEPWTGPQLVARVAMMARYQQASERIVRRSDDPGPPRTGDPLPASDASDGTPADAGASEPPAAPGSRSGPGLAPSPQPLRVPLPQVPDGIPALVPALPPVRLPPQIPVPIVTPPPLPRVEPPPAPTLPAPPTPALPVPDEPKGKRTPPGLAKKDEPPGKAD